MDQRIKKPLITFLKIAVSLALLYLVFTKVDIREVGRTLSRTHSGYMLLALFFFIISQVISSFRLNLFFHEAGMPLAHFSNMQLYLVGMFYNFFIPGGIGGDAYKVYLLKNHFGWKTKKLIKAVFLDRLSGLIAIGLLLTIMVIILIPGYAWPLKSVVTILLLLVILLTAKWTSRRFFSFGGKLYNRSLIYSILIQGCQLICVFFILKALSPEIHAILIYLVIFLVSSVLSVLSFSGIGIREYLFLQASVLFELDQSLAVSVGTVFSLITAVVSIFGLYFHFLKPELKLIIPSKAS
ncbi:lysylphosphatidylglycerol synthase transmembrane domain-containing protein [Robertkochia aurantiaca]|uniref:lysylphosphatidylglycerol synthase transmembrane domain-containing protein n=1 Tax=Robertkochia aurantiaca TaxID=2873700 RepID=UPI001CD02FB5|nr:lysylphosphatidylglycerol synthase transmembrane domain-containing protein [Robertkochia sp. 3YJGBD-33]